MKTSKKDLELYTESIEKKQLLVSRGCSFGESTDVAVFALLRAVHRALCADGEILAIHATILCPHHMSEKTRSMLSANLEKAYVSYGFSGAKLNIVEVQERSMFHCEVVVFWQEREEGSPTICGEAGQEIICTCSLGYEGILRLLDIKGEELKGRFVSSFFARYERGLTPMFAQRAIACGRQYGVTHMQSLDDGGIFAGLYQLGEKLQRGMDIDMQALPLFQETIECCEYLGLNPYQLSSCGCILMVTKEGKRLCDKLEELGVMATVIGVVTASNDRVCYRGEERRFLNKDVKEELLRFER